MKKTKQSVMKQTKKSVMSKLEFVHTQLNEMASKYSSNDYLEKIELLTEELGLPQLETTIYKLGFVDMNGDSLDFTNLDNWNNQLSDEFEPTTETELDKLYQAITTLKIKQLVMRDYLGNPKKYEVRSEGPSLGDIECIIEGLIEDKELEGDFQSLVERTLTIFNNK